MCFCHVIQYISLRSMLKGTRRKKKEKDETQFGNWVAAGVNLIIHFHLNSRLRRMLEPASPSSYLQKYTLFSAYSRNLFHTVSYIFPVFLVRVLDTDARLAYLHGISFVCAGSIDGIFRRVFIPIFFPWVVDLAVCFIYMKCKCLRV